MQAGEVIKRRVMIWWVCDGCNSRFVRKLRAGDVPPTRLKCPQCKAEWYRLDWPTEGHGISAYPGIKGIHGLGEMMALLERPMDWICDS